MKLIKHNTFSQRKEDVTRHWHLMDIKGEILGRVATKIARRLIGKHKATYTPHIDGGDYVVVINASRVNVTRNKAKTKIYYWHTGYVGGLKKRTYSEMMEKNPQEVIRRAVRNMLPKNRLRKNRMARLKIFTNDEHPHQSQLKTEKK